MSFSLIVGLGNPGRQYEATRHNVGFMLLDRLAVQAGACFQSSPKWQGHLAKLPDGGTWLLKPQTFMNLSGRSIRQVLAFYQWPPEQMLVVYDDAALPLETLRFREKDPPPATMASSPSSNTSAPTSSPASKSASAPANPTP